MGNSSTPSSTEPVYYNRTVSTESQISEPTRAELLNTELRDILPLVMERNNFRKINIKRTPPVFIDAESNPEEVQKWLEQKNFSDLTCKKLKLMRGDELFILTKMQIQQLCGIDEGKRLYHYILLQKNISNYQTTRTLELCEKLAKAREKAESNGSAKSSVFNGSSGDNDEENDGYKSN